MISIIMPTLNAAHGLRRSLPPLIPAVASGLVRELIISDAGSQDQTLAIGEAAGATIVRSALGEGAQSIAGALAARGAWFLFLHPFVALEPRWIDETARFIEGDGARTAVFRLGLEAKGLGARAAEVWANARAAWLNGSTREQGLLISRARYEGSGGFIAAPGARRELLGRLGRTHLLRARAMV